MVLGSVSEVGEYSSYFPREIMKNVSKKDAKQVLTSPFTATIKDKVKLNAARGRHGWEVIGSGDFSWVIRKVLSAGMTSACVSHWFSSIYRASNRDTVQYDGYGTSMLDIRQIERVSFRSGNIFLKSFGIFEDHTIVS